VANGLPARSRRVVALAMWAGASVLLIVAAVVYAGAFPLDSALRVRAVMVLGLVAMVDLLLGFWFFRSSLSS
jgi:hypothetical protein